MEKIKIVYREKSYEVSPLTTTLDFIKEYRIKVRNPMAVVLNGYLKRLNQNIKIDSTLDIIEFGSPQGKRIYEGSVIYLFIVIFTKKYPNLDLFIQHSIQKGIYVEIHGGELSEEEVGELQLAMKKMSDDTLPINENSKELDVVLDEMKKIHRQDIINLYKYNFDREYKYYELDGVQESLYLPLVPNTSYLSYFKLEKYQSGIVIILPLGKDITSIPKFVDRPKLFKTYQEYHEWSRVLKVRTVGQLNKYILHDGIDDLIKVAESFHEKKVAEIADRITHKKHIPRLILIAGPSSSGKTTFSKRLGIQLMVNSFKTLAISMDDYFIDRDKTPKDEDGNYDFESLEAIDIKLFTKHIKKLLEGGEIELPKFDFRTGVKGPSGKKIKLEKDQLIIIEGIHGLNPKLTVSINEKDKYKIYIAPLTQLNLHRRDRIPASDSRLIRRLVRDSFFRGYNASETLDRWRSVREGEKKNIFPLQEEADVIFNSALFYEFSVLKSFAEIELLRIDKFDSMYAEAQRLLKFLSYFLPLDTNEIPHTSILKEFIGGSTFKY